MTHMFQLPCPVYAGQLKQTPQVLCASGLKSGLFRPSAAEITFAPGPAAARPRIFFTERKHPVEKAAPVHDIAAPWFLFHDRRRRILRERLEQPWIGDGVNLLVFLLHYPRVVTAAQLFRAPGRGIARPAPQLLDMLVVVNFELALELLVREIEPHKAQVRKRSNVYHATSSGRFPVTAHTVEGRLAIRLSIDPLPPPSLRPFSCTRSHRRRAACDRPVNRPPRCSGRSAAGRSSRSSLSGP